MKRPVRAHVLAFLAAFAVIAVMSALWIVNLRLGPRLDGFTGGPIVVFVPFGILALTGFWLLLRALLHGRVRWRAVTVLVTALAFALAPVIVYCGPVACFAPGPNRLLGWFLVAGVVLAALVHHVVLERFTPEAGHASRRP